MSFSSVINLGTVSPTITSVKLSACTTSDCNNPQVISGYDSVFVSGFTPTRTVSGIPDGTKYIKVEALGNCGGTSQCLEITGIPGGPTPTPTPTVTVTPTPTNTPNTDVNPSYYYYAMGDCNDMRYSYTTLTITGFSPPIPGGGCETLATIGNLALQDPAHTTYTLSDPLDACGFGSSYVSTIIARSSTQITEQTVFNVGQQCLSVVAVETQYVTSWTIDLDDYTAVGVGYDACNSCSPPFTGFQITGYSGTTCDTGENVIAYSLLGITLGNVYGIQMYSGGTAVGAAKCATLTTNLGVQFVITDPETEGISGYGVSDTGPFVFGEPMFDGYNDCETCNGTERKYMITGDRCDTTGSITIWSTTAPTLTVGDTFSVSIVGTIVCFEVTQADQFTSVVYNDLGWEIVETGCDCNGNSGGSNVNVDNIVASPMDSGSTLSECQGSMGQYYNEYYIYDVELIFRDINNNQVIPNQPVTYRINGGSWQSLTVDSAIEVISTTLTYYDNTVCGGGPFAETLDVKVGTLTILNYVAGQ
jgi:uncharacterized membrane protein